LTDFMRRFRGFGVALVVLAMSAGVVFAAAPLAQPSANSEPSAETPSAGDEDASEAPESEAPESEAPESEAPESEAPEAPDAQDKQDTETEGTGDNHGALVSAAAQMPTPAGFRNHGAFVSCVAHLKDATLATIDWTTVTPEACAAAKGDKGKGDTAGGNANKAADKAERQAAKDAAKAARDAAKAARKAATGH
jgi:hypothetical protein